jgi:lipoate---protein ligase
VLLILSENTDVYFNLAAEEHILHHFQEDVLMLWRSKSAVVCGKHQNICAELNYGYCKTNNIQTARRLTGGGTVYHDLGNINFTFIQNLQDGLENAINFKRFLDPVKAALQEMGVNAQYSDRNDLLLDGKKISGNAEHIFQKQKRVLHHGTLLFDADLSNLRNALHPIGTYIDKAVKSVRSEVTNIRTALPNTTTEEFLQNLYQYWAKQEHTNRYVFCAKDVESIDNLQVNKYAALSWIVHYSPKYSVKRLLNGPLGEWRMQMQVMDGKIAELNLETDSETAKEYFRTINLTEWIGHTVDENLSNLFAEKLKDAMNQKDDYLLF